MNNQSLFFRFCSEIKNRAILLLTLASLFPCDHAFGYIVYVVNNGNGTVSALDSTTNMPVSAPIPVGVAPTGIAITPNRKFAYVTNQTSGTVTVIDTVTNMPFGAPIGVGMNPIGIAINSNGLAFVANNMSNTVSVIDTNTHMTVGAPIPVGVSPAGVAINSAGFVYVTNQGAPASVYVIDSNMPVPTVVHMITAGLGTNPTGIAINSAGFAYVANQSGPVSVIDTNQMVPSVVGSVAVGSTPFAVAITPSGYPYVTRAGGASVTVLDTNLPVPGIVSTIGVGASPFGIAITPDGAFAYVANLGAGTVTVLDSSMPAPVFSATLMGFTNPFGIAIFSLPAADPPTSLQGVQRKNDFATIYERYNILQWGPSPSTDPPVAGYFIYRDGARIASVNASTFEYVDHNRPNVATLYSVTAYNTNGDESTPISVTIE